jgi:DNA-binding NarL/FixJ family response regulator
LTPRTSLDSIASLAMNDHGIAGAMSTRGEGLTPAQQRVAELAAAGMSNREIAGELFMSLRTVEAHLTKIYWELGVKSRAQLAAAMAATGVPRA